MAEPERSPYVDLALLDDLETAAAGTKWKCTSSSPGAVAQVQSRSGRTGDRNAGCHIGNVTYTMRPTETVWSLGTSYSTQGRGG
ncbi:hypothetical protein SGFS_056130 [Streptomyces graminofaciens]|uniref:Uncharacterized protein n=1 Tax=Streptomyces graminofaciens TaxID=68212 RepID=A0ABN5VLX7_9ACTN|nr:hypothetical protein SGFS_056130 [Streptomyces graminofaciens]